MTVRFRRSSLVPVLVFSIASGLVLVGLVGAETMQGQQRASLETSDHSKSANARLTSLGAVTNHSTQAAAEDKSYHGSVGPYLPLNILWRIQTGGGDRTITADPTERDTKGFYFRKPNAP